MLTIVRRLGPIAIDQALSSLSNMLATVVVARQLSMDDLGRFALIYSVYSFGLGLTRAYVQEPMLLTVGTLQAEERHRYIRRAYAAGSLVGLGIGLTCLLLAACVPSLREACVPVALLASPLILQDVVRYHDFANKRADRAIISDAIWIGLFVGASGFTDDLGGIAIAWAASGVIAGVLVRPGLVLHGLATRPQVGWFTEHRSSGGFFTVDFLIGQAVQQCSIWFNAAFVSAASAGAYRAGQLFIAPLRTVSGAAIVALLPRMSQSEPDRIVALATRYVRHNVFAAAVSFVAISVAPSSLGSHLLGEAWTDGRNVGRILCVAMAVAAFTQSRMLVIKATQMFSRSMKVRAAEMPVILAAVLIGTLAGGASGAAAGFLGGAVIALPWWEKAAQAALRDYEKHRDAAVAVVN